MKKFFIVFVVIAGVGSGVYLFLEFRATEPETAVAPAIRNSAVVSTVPPEPGEIAPVGQAILYGRAKPASPAAAPDYSSIEVAVKSSASGREIGRTNLAADGSYRFNLPIGYYVLSIVPGTGSSGDLPQTVHIGSTEAVEVNFKVR